MMELQVEGLRDYAWGHNQCQVALIKMTDDLNMFRKCLANKPRFSQLLNRARRARNLIP